MAVIMDAILMEKLGSASVERVVFKKTVNVAQYETEVFECDASIEFESGVTGIERVLANHIVFAQLEYSVLLKLVLKGVITKQDMDKDIEKSEYGIRLLVDKAKSMGVNVDIQKYMQKIG